MLVRNSSDTQPGPNVNQTFVDLVCNLVPVMPTHMFHVQSRVLKNYIETIVYI